MASEEDQRLHDVGVAALAAVAQYPHAVNQESGSLLMTEVVNAMTGGALPPDPFTLQHIQEGSHQLPNVSGTNHARPFIPERVSAEPVIFSPGSRIFSDVGDSNMDISVQQVTVAPSNNFATVVRNDLSEDDDMSDDLSFDLEPVWDGNHPPPSIDSNDELEDLIRFYPDEEEYYHQRYKPYTRAGYPMMDEVDLDDFYATVNYSVTDPSLPQIPANPGPGPLPLSEDHGEVHPETIVHTASTSRFSVSQSK
jgi:hypothetical protein